MDDQATTMGCFHISINHEMQRGRVDTVLICKADGRGFEPTDIILPMIDASIANNSNLFYNSKLIDLIKILLVWPPLQTAASYFIIQS